MKITLKVATLIFNQDKDILLIKEKYSKKLSYKWNIIKGTYDKGTETIENCALREIKEETGLSVKKVKLRRIYKYGDKKNIRILFIFSTEIKNSHKIHFKYNKKNENIIEAKWFSKKELNKIDPNDFMNDYVTKSFDLVHKNKNSKIEFLELF